LSGYCFLTYVQIDYVARFSLIAASGSATRRVPCMKRGVSGCGRYGVVTK